MYKDFRVGQRVVAANSAPCEECFFCRRGLQNLCEDLLFNNGAYAEYIRIPARIVERNTYEIPGACELSGRGAWSSRWPACCAGLEETASAAGRHHRGIGPGTHRPDVRAPGQSLYGCRVIAIGRRQTQLDRAAAMGADELVRRRRAYEYRAKRCASLTGGRGADIAMEAVGKPETWALAARYGAARRHGQLLRRLPQRQPRELDTTCCITPKSPARPASITRPRTSARRWTWSTAATSRSRDFVNREEPLANLLEVMRHLMSHNGHLKTAIIP